MKNVMIALALMGAAGSALAAPISFTGPQITENFNGLPATTQTGVFSNVSGTQAAISGVNGWVGAKLSGTGATATALTVDDGTSNSGGIFNYGVTGDADRSLGMLASGSNIMGFGVEIVNNWTFPLLQFTITFDREQYRSSSVTTNTMAFAYGVSGGTATGSNFLTDVSLVANTAGDLVGDAFVTTNGKLAPPSIITNVTATINLVAAVPVGGSLYLRWTDVNDTGNDAGIAIDNFRFNAIPAPGSIALLGLGGLAAARRKR